MFARCIRAQLNRRMRLLTDEELCEPTAVLAPHQDDETLGCGGTIARKRKLGARVQVIYLTDGCRSHQGRIDKAQLAAIRAKEAVTACTTLGVKESNVHFLGIENGELEHDEQREQATQALVERFSTDMPRQVFVPYHLEPPPDHYVTTSVAMEAIRRLDLNVSVYEYPIWFWHYWPFSWDDAHTLRELARRYRTMLRRVGPTVRELRVGVDVRDELQVKRQALDAHASQVARRGGDQDWPILDDVCHGAFTELFFQPIELFYESHHAPLTESPMQSQAEIAALGAPT